MWYSIPTSDYEKTTLNEVEVVAAVWKTYFVVSFFFLEMNEFNCRMTYYQ